MRLSTLALAVLTLAGGSLAACASDPGPPPMRGPGGPGGPEVFGGPPPGLFVSPFGELFMSEPGQPWPVADWFAGADKDSDGRITGEEFVADGQRFFAALDLRRDDRLTPDEIAVYERSLDEARARLPGFAGPGQRGQGRRLEGFSGGAALAEGAQDDDGQQRGPRARAPQGPLGYGPIAAAGFFNYPEPVKAADADTSQTITPEEWSQATDRWFLALDTDHDGVLTLATLPQTPLQGLMERGRR